MNLNVIIPVFAILVLVIIITCVATRRWRRRVRRRNAAMRPFPQNWVKLLAQNVVLYRCLPSELREQLHRDIHIFLEEKTFEGCGGLEITEEMKLVIAAQACILLLNRPNSDFPTLNSILVYPEPYMARTTRATGTHLINEPSFRAGESWTGGDLVLAWDHTERSARTYKASSNVVLHEFAHQLDQEDGVADGAPILESRAHYSSWAHVLSAEYKELKNEISQHESTVLSPYGATNPAEFFAVATETFFTRSRVLKKHEPELYDELASFYHLDPASWRENMSTDGEPLTNIQE